MARKVLVIDDTRNIQIMLRDFLESQGFEVEIAGDGIEAFDSIERSQPDLILLDIMMPNMDGYQFISQLRKASDLPVIMITAKQQEADIVHGFELGADDYITKPFKLRELLMRMRAVLRRSTPEEEEKPITIIGDLQLDRSRHKVTLRDELIELTPLEFFVLDILMDSQGKVVRKEDLCIRLIENGFSGSESTLKIHIRNIRMKLRDELDQPKYIETVFGIGYRFLEGS